jgi:hypothetical protein
MVRNRFRKPAPERACRFESCPLRTFSTMETPSYYPEVGSSSLEIISRERHRNIWSVDESELLILDPIESDGIKLPVPGMFIDIGAGSGALVLGLALSIQTTSPDSQFIGVDILGPSIHQVDVPKEQLGRVQFIWETDGFSFIQQLPSDVACILACTGINEMIGTLQFPTNIPFLAFHAGRILKPNGVLYVCPGFSDREVELLKQSSQNRLKPLNNHNQLFVSNRS